MQSDTELNKDYKVLVLLLLLPVLAMPRGTVFRSTGSAVKDIITRTGSFFHQILGGISGSIMWSVIFLFFIAYQIYLKWSTKSTQSRSPFPQLPQDQVISSTPPVPVLTTHLFLVILLNHFPLLQQHLTLLRNRL